MRVSAPDGAGTSPTQSTKVDAVMETVGRAPSIRKDVGTEDAFERYVKKWLQKRYDNYPVLYLATHGEPGHVYVGDDRISLASLATIIGKTNAAKRAVHFGSCSTLFDDPDGTHGDETMTAREFVRASGLRYIVGYQDDVDWLESASFDLLLLPVLLDPANGPKAVFDSVMEIQPDLAKRLGFAVVTRTATYSSGTAH